MLRALVLGMLLAGCHSPWERIDRTTLPSAAATPTGGVVLLDDQELALRSDARSGKPVAELSCRLRVLILSELGQSLAQQYVQYDPRYRTLLEFHARTVAPDGHERLYEQRDARDLPAKPDFALYSDVRALGLDLRPVAPGTIVELSYKVHLVDPELFQFEHTFGNQFPVERSVLSVSAPLDWAIESRARRREETLDWPPEHTQVAGRQLWRWQKDRLVPPIEERLAPDLPLRLPQVLVRLQRWTEGGKPKEPFSGARALSAFFYRFTLDGQHAGELEAQVRELTAGAGDDPRARAQRLYAFVRDHIGYCAIDIGEGGWRPHAAREVLGVRYGDCKDKANLLHELLTIAKIDSRLAAIFSHHGYPQPIGLPTMAGNFNHMALVIDLPSGPLFADPTSRTAAFGEPPASDEEAALLPYSESGSDYQRVPSLDAEASRFSEQLTLTLSPRGSASGRFAIEDSGHAAEALRSGLLHAGPADRERSIADRLALKRPGVRGIAVENEQPTAAPTAIRVTGEVMIGDLLASMGSARTLRAGDFVDRWVASLPSGERHEPVVLGFRHLRTQRVQLQLPDGTQVTHLPDPVLLEGAFGSYSLRWQLDGTQLTLERQYRQLERVVAAADYAALRTFFEAVVSAEARTVVLTIPK